MNRRKFLGTSIGLSSLTFTNFMFGTTFNFMFGPSLLVGHRELDILGTFNKKKMKAKVLLNYTIIYG